MSERVMLNYPFFDGKKGIAKITLEDGKIISIEQSETIDSKYLLMPGLIDSHMHINSQAQIDFIVDRIVLTDWAQTLGNVMSLSTEQIAFKFGMLLASLNI